MILNMMAVAIVKTSLTKNGRTVRHLEHVLCLENVFGSLCFALLDGEKCNSCSPGAVSRDQCPDMKPGTRILLQCEFQFQSQYRFV